MDNHISNNLTEDAVDLILSTFSDELEHHDNKEELLKEWCTRYPNLANELIGIAFDTLVFIDDTHDQTDSQAQLMSEILTTDYEAIFLESGLEQHSSYDYAKKNASLQEDQPSSLESAFVKKGMDFPQVVVPLLHLPENIIKQLSDKKIDILTIPILLIEKVAGILDCDVKSVLNMLSRTNLQTSASMAFEARSQYNFLSDFSELLKRSDATKEDVDYWMQVAKYSRFVDKNDINDN